MYSRSANGGEKGDPNRNPWLAKMNDTMVAKFKKKWWQKLVEIAHEYTGSQNPQYHQYVI